MANRVFKIMLTPAVTSDSWMHAPASDVFVSKLEATTAYNDPIKGAGFDAID